MEKVLLLYSPFPSMKLAKLAANKLLKERLIACANITQSSSLYEWKGKLVDEKEFILLAKTTDKKRRKVEERVRSLHPYELPAVLFLSPLSVNQDYAKWVFDCCSKG